MKNEHLRNKDMIGMRLRGGKGAHGGNKAIQNKRNRKSIRQKLRHPKGDE